VVSHPHAFVQVALPGRDFHVLDRHSHLDFPENFFGGGVSVVGGFRNRTVLARTFAAQVETLKRGMAQRLLPCSDA
jgi:hypothetical protein